MLGAEFFARSPVVVAPELLGKRLMRQTSAGVCGGIIVEVEAYLSCRDAACHASRGMTPRNRSMFGPPGRAYVYTIHTRWLLNAVTEPEGTPSAILIRAIQPLVGIDLMQQRRRTDVVRDLARGPGRLCEALAIDRTYDGWDLSRGEELWIESVDVAGERPMRIVRSGRIGISAAKHRLLRFYLAGNRFVSGRRGAASSKK
jgi:DNA-3-methyladenine glycosylase